MSEYPDPVVARGVEANHRHVSLEEQADALSPDVGAGGPLDAPERVPEPPVVEREPVVLLVLVAVLTELGGAVTLLAADHTLAGALVAAGALLTGVGGALARSLVSPVARGGWRN